MNGKERIVKNIYFHLNQYGDFILSEIEIYDEVNEIYIKANKIYINNDNIAMIELESGNDIDIEELSYNELLCVYEEII